MYFCSFHCHVRSTAPNANYERGLDAVSLDIPNQAAGDSKGILSTLPADLGPRVVANWTYRPRSTFMTRGPALAMPHSLGTVVL